MEKRFGSNRVTRPIGAFVVLLLMVAAGCGGGGGETPPPPAELQTVVIPTQRIVAQGATDVPLRVEGTNFRAGGQLVVSGQGVVVTETTIVSETEATALVTVDIDAAYGSRDVLYFGYAGASTPESTLTGAIEVCAPEPEPDMLTPGVVTQGDQGVTLTLTGMHFREGGAIALGVGIQVTSSTWISEEEFEITIDVDENADLGLHVLLFTQPVEGGGAQRPLWDALQVNAPEPTFISVTPAVLKQGEQAIELSVEGTRFRAGGTILVGGTDLQVGTTTVLSESNAIVDVTVPEDAAVGPRLVGFEQPAAGGSAQATDAGGLSVHYPDPEVTSISPATLNQDSSQTTVTVKGEGFRTGGTLKASGTGLTLENTQIVSATEATVDVTVADTATIGNRSLTYTQPSDGGGAEATGTDLLTINYPDPTVTSVSPTTLKQGSSQTTVTVKGTNFRSGGTLTVSGTGLTLGSTQVVSATEAKVDVTLADAATIGKRSVTYTQPSDGGGAFATGTDLLTIQYPDPKVTSVSPTTLKQATSAQMTITGENFRSGGTLSTSRTGVTLSSATFVSETSFKVTAETASTAPLGDRDLTYTQPSDGGGAAHTLEDAYAVLLQPTFVPSQWLAGDARISVEVVGAGFDTGTKISVSGTGVTVHSTTRISSTSLIAELTITPNATLGARDVTITPGDTSKSPATFKEVARVVPAGPTVTGFTPLTIAKGASGVAVTVYGTNFRSGATLSSGGGITVKSVTVVSAEAITASLDVSSTATAGTRDVAVAHSATEGGATGTREAAFRVLSSTPTVTAVSPALIGRTGSSGPTRNVPVSVTGTNFASSATLSVTKTSGSGVSVVSDTVVSDTVLEAVLAITGTASTGKWDLKVTNPGGTGNSGTTGNGLLDIKSESTLTVNNVSPASGSAHGGELITIYGAGFASQAVVDFGKVRASGTQVVDQNTIVTPVPVPASVSSSGPTDVDVVVTNSSGSSATLTKGYRYARDDSLFYILGSYPPHGSTGVPKNFVSGAVLLSAPVDTTTGTYGTTQGTNCRWFEGGANYVSNGYRTFGPAARWLVFSRTGGGNLPINNQGLYVLETPTALLSIGGSPLIPTYLSSSGNRDQCTFTISSSATDTTAPKLSTIKPADKATGVSMTTRVVLTMDEPIDPQTVTTTTITLKQGTTTVPASIILWGDLKTITITPFTELAASTTYTTAVTASVKDFCGNAFSSTSCTFTTSGSDATAPTIDDVVIEALPPDMDGSGTYVNSSGAGGNAFDVFLPRGGWQVTVYYSDEGGAGIDESTFSAKANVAVGSTSANTELASNFTVTSTQAMWRIPATGFATGDNATFTFKISDSASTPNVSGSKVVTVDVFDLAGTAYNGGDYDPFGSRDTWVLRFDLDAYTASYSTTSSPPQQGATTTAQSNGLLDVDESLRLVGLNSGSMTTAAAATVYGRYRGTNAIVREMLMYLIRARLRERYGIGWDGTRYADSVNIEFLLPGEQGSLSAMPTYSSTQAQSSSKAFSEMSIGGTYGTEANAYTAGSLGTAWGDPRNTKREADINTGSGTIVGVHLLSMLKHNVNAGTGSYFGSLVSSKLVTIHGGTPVGEHTSDDDVLAEGFDRTTSTNSTHNARYDTIMVAIDLVALYTSSVTAHEIGHAVGLVQDGAPKTGLFGGAHYNNTFTEATSVASNTSWHMDYPGNDLMGATVDFDDAVLTGAYFQRFSPMNRAYLLRRLGYDEGK